MNRSSVIAVVQRTTWQQRWLWWGGGVALVVVLLANLALAGWALNAIAAAPLAVLAMLAMSTLPGLALLRLLWPLPLAADERWPLAMSISYALPPLLLLGSDLVGLRWNGWLCWGYLALSALVALVPVHRLHRTQVGSQPSSRVQGNQEGTDRVQGNRWATIILLLLITAVALAVRLYTARDLVVGQFGDSYHHTVIAQLLVEHGGLFQSWQPYAELSTFTYHFGFHSNVAWLHWLSGYPVTRGVVIVGQVQSALAAPLVYLLALRLLRDRTAALWAALLVAVVCTMPAYYVNWGRYTQLAGQTVLVAVVVAWAALLHAPVAALPGRGLLRLGTLAALVTAGLALTHYRVALLAGCFVTVYALGLLVSHWRASRALGRVIGVGAVSGTAAILLVVPWFLRLRESKLAQIGGYYLQNDIGTSEGNALPPLAAVLTYTTLPVLVLAILGVCVVFWRRNGWALLGWAALMWIAANPYLVGLPGAGIISGFAVLVANYLVLAPLAGLAVATLAVWIAAAVRSTQAVPGLHVVAATAVVLWGIGPQRQMVDQNFSLFTPADAAAMAWIRNETPPDAHIFVNSFGAYSGTFYAGSDGGWWLPFFTGRESNLPPATYGTELGATSGYQQAVGEVNAAVLDQPLNTPAAAATLRAEGFDYLYDGPAANPGDEYINPKVLVDSALYDEVYAHDGVTIWRIR